MMARREPRLPERVTEAQAMGLALERLRRATEKVLNAVALQENIDTVMCELEAAFASSDQDTHTYLHWAQDVLDGAIEHRKARRGGRKKESLDTVRKAAAHYNIYVHFVHTLEGTEYAIYRAHTKVAHARSDQRCISVLRRLMKTKG